MRRFIVPLVLVALIAIGAVNSAHAATGSELISQYGCLGCHGGGIPQVGTDAASEAAAIYSSINGGSMNGISSLKTLTQADALAIAQTLFPAAACTSYTYTLGACQSNNTAPVISYVGVPAGCSGGVTPETTQPCTYVPPAPETCTSFTYSAWGTCQPDGTQTRTVVSSSPSGCTGGTPVTTQSCTYTPPPTADGATLYANNCASCHGSLASSEVKGKTAAQIQSAINSVSAMSGLKTLTSAEIQAIATALGTTTPPPAGSAMPLPTGQEVFPYDPLASPVPSSNPEQAMPIGLGAAATGGDTLTLHITASFQSPVNIYVTMFTPSSIGFSPFHIKMLGGGGMFRPLKMDDDIIKPRRWKTGVTSVDETVTNSVPLSQLKSGVYYVVMTVTPTTEKKQYYQWITYFIVP